MKSEATAPVSLAPESPAAGERGLKYEHERVERVAVLAKRVRHEAVVGRVLGRGEQGAVQADEAALVVDLVLVPAAPRDLDPDFELHGGLSRCKPRH
jgi:hypothetical protein